MERDIQVIPHHGFCSVRLGMTREQVVNILGSPAVEDERTGAVGSEDIEWDYTRSGVTLCFHSDAQFRLLTISFEGPRTLLLGAYPIQTSETNLRAMFLREPDLRLEVEDDYHPEFHAKDYWCETLGLQFFVQSGRVVRLTMFPQYVGDKPVWPPS